MILPVDTVIHRETARPVVMRFVVFGDEVRLEVLFDGDEEWKDAGTFSSDEFAVFCVSDFETERGKGVMARVTHSV